MANYCYNVITRLAIKLYQNKIPFKLLTLKNNFHFIEKNEIFKANTIFFDKIFDIYTKHNFIDNRKDVNNVFLSTFHRFNINNGAFLNISTVHDITAYKFPWYWKGTKNYLVKKFKNKLRFKNLIRYSSVIATVSETTKLDLQSFFLDKRTFKVINVGNSVNTS